MVVSPIHRFIVFKSDKFFPTFQTIDNKVCLKPRTIKHYNLFYEFCILLRHFLTLNVRIKNISPLLFKDFLAKVLIILLRVKKLDFYLVTKKLDG